MKIVPSIINQSLHLLKSHIWEKDLSQKYADGEPPLRSELFSTEQMEQYAKVLAGLHLLGPKVEPYVIAADVYALSPHTGRGGWTWYTGSAGWMYRLIIESLLGLRLETNKLYIEPCIPSDWNSYKIHYRYRDTVYQIMVTQIHDAITQSKIILDGVECQGNFISLTDDHQEHYAEVKYYPSS